MNLPLAKRTIEKGRSLLLYALVRSGLTGFTLTEMMIALALLSLVVLGGIYSHLLGLRMSTIIQSKLESTAYARSALNDTRDEIRSCQTVAVGNGSRTAFTTFATNAPRAGNALQIYPTASTNVFIRYYLDPNDQSLRRITSGSSTGVVVASFVTNQIAFTAEDFAGNVLTNDQDNFVIQMNLEFSQFDYAVLDARKISVVDYYRIQTRTTRRAVE